MGTTFTDASAVGSGFVAKPSTWSLEAGHRFLKGVVPEVVPAGDETLGITQADITAAENFSWRFIVSRLIGWYEVSGWSSSPPHPLYEIWDLLSSSYVLAVVAQRKNVEDSASGETQDRWTAQAAGMLRDLVDPEVEGDRLHLINQDGTLEHKRAQISIPKIVSTSGVVFWPSGKSFSTAWGDTIEGSVEQFINEHAIFSN